MSVVGGQRVQSGRWSEWSVVRKFKVVGGQSGRGNGFNAFLKSVERIIES